jgi:signal transduction histidine kinase
MPTQAATREITELSLLFSGLIFVLMAIVAVWSWHRRRVAEALKRDSDIALRAANANLVRFSSALPLAAFCFKPGSGFTSISDGVFRLAHIDAQHIKANPLHFFAALHPEDRAPLSWMRGEGEIPPVLVWEGRTHNSHAGELRWLQIRAAIDLTPEGEQVLAGVITDITDIKTAQHAAEHSREELRRLAAYRENQREIEYRHLAREFHDELGQLVSSVRMRLQLLTHPVTPNVQDELALVDALLSQAYRSVKTIVSSLRPPALDMGIAAAAENQAEQVLRPLDLLYAISICAEAESLPDNAKIVLFRIIQESFTNIVKHAQARTVHLTIDADATHIHLKIIDDGCGFKPSQVDSTAHFGLVGMRERMMALGGTLELRSAPTQGTQLTATLPRAEQTPGESP